MAEACENNLDDILVAIPDSLRARLRPLAQRRTYMPGAVLFVEGGTHFDFHIVAKGHVRLEMLVPQRGRIPILTAGPGDVLAWSSVLGNSVMTSSAIALESVLTLAFDGRQLKQLCDADRDFGFEFMRFLAQALSRRLLATRLQLLDLFGEGSVTATTFSDAVGLVDPEC